MTKRLFLTLVIAVALAVVLPTVAMANFAIHGNYLTDTDACAGCHRAHTSVSSLQWHEPTVDAQGNTVEHYSLLVSTATRMQDFCYACHGADAQGADTNVQDGVYEGTLYGSNEATLNGGGFDTLGLSGTPVTSTHLTDGSKWGAYGGGNYGSGDTSATGEQLEPDGGLSTTGESQQIVMDCTSCHDPHGSSNYRLLKAKVFGNAVGGYEPSATAPTNPTPDAFVQSTEQGWPTDGFRLHTAYPNYVPDYTTPRYAKGYDMAAGNTATNTAKGMTGWCSGCHTTYNDRQSVYNSGDKAELPSVPGDPNSAPTSLVTRHRHPVNVDFDGYLGPDKESMVITDNPLPVDHDLSEAGNGAQTTQSSDWIECLTCHRAHGTAAVMTGLAQGPVKNVDGTNDGNIPDFISGTPSALLRNDNRGVCEVCHNK